MQKREFKGNYTFSNVKEYPIVGQIYDTEVRIAEVDDKVADSYLLVPPPFQEKYGKWIKEECYDGYGNMGGYDVYDLVAEWNREYLNESMLRKPQREQWRPEDEEYYLNAMERYNNRVKVLNHYRETGELLQVNEWKEELRILGIDIACYDEQNAALPFPIKITSKPMEYGMASASESDPDQGWEYEDDDYDEDDEW